MSAKLELMMHFIPKSDKAHGACSLEEQKITYGNNETTFEIDQFKKKCLLEGLDDIALSLEKNPKITEFEKKLVTNKPWILND